MEVKVENLVMPPNGYPLNGALKGDVNLNGLISNGFHKTWVAANDIRKLKSTDTRYSLSNGYTANGVTCKVNQNGHGSHETKHGAHSSNGHADEHSVTNGYKHVNGDSSPSKKSTVVSSKSHVNGQNGFDDRPAYTDLDNGFVHRQQATTCQNGHEHLKELNGHSGVHINGHSGKSTQLNGCAESHGKGQPSADVNNNSKDIENLYQEYDDDLESSFEECSFEEELQLKNFAEQAINGHFSHECAGIGRSSPLDRNNNQSSKSDIETSVVPETQDSQKQHDIVEFFKGKSILITGGTGFIGKVLVQKLLRSCPDLGTIYLIVRPKKGKLHQERMKEYFNCELFDELLKLYPSCTRKVVSMSGDLSSPDLGLNLQDIQKIRSSVSIVIHSAATVRFDEPLRNAVTTNVLATKNIMELCKQLAHAEAIVHVSTAYSNCNRKEISEKIYPNAIDPNQFLDSYALLDDDVLEKITPRLLDNHPNTYTFTKSLAEQIVLGYSDELPISIIRPSIVTGSVKEPFPGWIDNLNGPTGLMVALGKGILHVCPTDNTLVIDCVPVDLLVNLIVAITWNTAVKDDKIQVFHCTSGNINPVRFRQAVEWGMNNVIKNPFENVVWYPSMIYINSTLGYRLATLVFDYGPAYIIDTIIRLFTKPIMVKLQSRIHHTLNVVKFFMVNEFKFENTNAANLWDRMTDEDRDKFDFDLKNFDWEEYIESICLGTRRYVMKEKLASLPSSRKHIQRLFWIKKSFQLFLLWLCFKTCFMIPGFDDLSSLGLPQMMSALSPYSAVLQ